MKKQTIKGFVGSKINIIDEMQSKGFYLQSIHEEVKKEYPEDIPFKTFKDALYKIRSEAKNINSIEITEPKVESKNTEYLEQKNQVDEKIENNSLSFAFISPRTQNKKREQDENSDN
jgi:hypothetical protein